MHLIARNIKYYCFAPPDSVNGEDNKKKKYHFLIFYVVESKGYSFRFPNDENGYIGEYLHPTWTP